VLVVMAAAARDGGPARESGDTAIVVLPPATGVPPSSTTMVALTTSGEGGAEAVGSDDSDGLGYGAGGDGERPGPVVSNAGSATADVGGNVVTGVPGPGGPPAAVDATAAGNISSVRTP